jgi:hypothetical protein
MRDSKGRQSCRPAFGVSGYRYHLQASTLMEGLALMGAKGGLAPPALGLRRQGAFGPRGDHEVGPVNGLDALLIRCIKENCIYSTMVVE